MQCRHDNRPEAGSCNEGGGWLSRRTRVGADLSPAARLTKQAGSGPRAQSG